MKSIKPGRRRSRYNAVGAVIGIVFGIIWTIAALSMGAPFFFPLFGLVFIGMGVYNAVYNYRNATSENRYREFDITDENEEPDPLNERYGANKSAGSGDANAVHGGGFCPYCGTKAEEGYEYCRKCGKKLPD